MKVMLTSIPSIGFHIIGVSHFVGICLWPPIQMLIRELFAGKKGNKKNQCPSNDLGYYGTNEYLFASFLKLIYFRLAS